MKRAWRPEEVKNVNNIVLIGMPGAGKSTVGVILAKVLGMLFIDTDLVIQEKENRLLQNIIDNDGISRFMNIEERTILSVKPEHPAVIATGGSAVYSTAAMEHLKKDGIIVYLKLDFHEIEKRLKNISTRGIVIDRGCSLLDVFIQRIPLYEKYADITVDCMKKDTEMIVREITEKIRA